MQINLKNLTFSMNLTSFAGYFGPFFGRFELDNLLKFMETYSQVIQETFCNLFNQKK